MKRVMPLEGACKDFEEDLVLYYYGESSHEDRSRIELHLSGCSGCRSFVDDLRRLLPAMARSEELPPAFWDAYYRDTLAKLAERENRKSWWRDLLAPMRVWMVPAFGTAAMAVLAIALVFGKGDAKRASDPASDAIPQEILADANQLEFFKSMDLLESLRKLEEQDEQRVNPAANQSSSLNMIGGAA
jgi:predicted anti-sigma-YlaC factor YlaD